MPNSPVIRLHRHARERMAERGITEEEVHLTIIEGEQFPAKLGRTGFRRNFVFLGIWQGKRYAAKQVELYAAWEENGWTVLSVVGKYF